MIFLFFVLLFKFEKGLLSKIKLGFVFSVFVKVMCWVLFFDKVIGYFLSKCFIFRVWISLLICLEGLVINVMLL